MTRTFAAPALVLALTLPAVAQPADDFQPADAVVGTFATDRGGELSIRASADGWYRLSGTVDGATPLEARGLHRTAGWLFLVEPQSAAPAGDSPGLIGVVAGDLPPGVDAPSDERGPWLATVTRSRRLLPSPRLASLATGRLSVGTTVIVSARRDRFAEVVTPEGPRWVEAGGLRRTGPVATFMVRQDDERRFLLGDGPDAVRLERTSSFAPEAVARAKAYWVANATGALGETTDCITTVNAAVRRLFADPAQPVDDRMHRTMNRLSAAGRAQAGVELEFLNASGRRTLGVTAPERLSVSAWETLRALSGGAPGWHVFGLSVMDGFHSVSLVLDQRDPDAPRAFWCDQWSSQGGWFEVTGQALDAKIERHTRSWWNPSKPTRTRATLWRLLPDRRPGDLAAVAASAGLTRDAADAPLTVPASIDAPLGQ